MTDIETGDIQAAIDAGKELAALQVVPGTEELEQRAIIFKHGFEYRSVDNALPRPLRKTGQRAFVDAKSFCSYVNKHKVEDETVIIADEDKAKIKAIFNDHGNEPAWGDFSALFELGFSEEWKTWSKNAYPKRDTFFSQSEFVDFIEDNRADLKVGIFPDADGKMNLSLRDTAGEMLVVSQFTLMGDCRKGRRPSFSYAAAPDQAEHLYEYFVEQVRANDVRVQTGRFGAKMAVELINDGPVTFIVESK